MKLSFLIQLLLLIILILGVYMIFTNSIAGRTRLIMIVFLVFIGVYLFNQMSIFKSYNEIISRPLSAKEEYKISSDLLKKSNGHFTLSSWVYVNDWNYKYGQEKVIVTKQGIPKIYLDEYKNDLKIDLDVMLDNAADFQQTMTDALSEAGIPIGEDNVLTCVDGTIHIDGTPATTDSATVPCANNSTMETITIENMNLQKWVNIVVAVNDRTMDVYLNGKLVTSKAFNNIIDTGALNNGDIIVTPDNGFGGFVSKVEYYPYFITPKDAWSIYKDGFGNSIAGILNKYNMSLTFYEDAVEKKKYWIF